VRCLSVCSALVLALALAGCVQGSASSSSVTLGSSVAPTFELGGTIAGLGESSGLVLANGTTMLTVPAASPTFSFPPLPLGSTYAVTVQSAPPGLTCSVAGGSGTLKANVGNVVVTCSDLAYTVGGTIVLAPTVSAASFTGLVLVNGPDTVTVPTGAATFTMPTPVAFGSSYQVMVKTQPTGLSCTVNPATPMTMPAKPVTTVVVSCSNQPYALGGTVTINGPAGAALSDLGLTIGNTSNGDSYTFASNASSFLMPKRVAFGAAYALTVTTQPPGLICAIANPNGFMPATAVNVVVTCADQAFTLSGSVTIDSPTGVSGLSDQGLVLTNSANGDVFTFASNASTFVMPMSVPYGSAYLISVTTQPPGLNCSVSDPSTTMPPENVATIAVTCSDQSFTLGGMISTLGSHSGLVLTNNGADATTILAGATSFTMNTQVPFGAAFAVAVAQNPTTFTCTVTGGTGTGTMPAANFNPVAIGCAVNPVVAYVANATDNTLSAYTVDATTGAMTALAGSPFATGTDPFSVAVNPAGSFAYVANFVDNTVSAYSIDRATGILTAVAGGPVATGSAPFYVAVNPAGTFAYVANSNDDTVSVYGIDATTGALTQIPGSPFPTGNFPVAVNFNPAGTVAYVTNQDNGTVAGTVSVFSVDPTTGALTQVGSPVPTGIDPTALAINPAGSFAFVANFGDGTVWVYGIDPGTGALAPVAGNPFLAGTNPFAVTVNPAGTFAFVTNANDSTVEVFSINPGTGALTQITGSPYGTGSYPEAEALNPAGTFAFVAAFGQNNLTVFSIDPTTGVLTPLASSPVATGTNPFSIVVFQPQ